MTRLIPLAIGRVESGSSNSPNGELALANSRWSDGVGSVVPMLGNCSFDGLIDPSRRTCRVIILRIRNFSFLYSYFPFRKVSRELFDIDFVVTDFDPNS